MAHPAPNTAAHLGQQQIPAPVPGAERDMPGNAVFGFGQMEVQNTDAGNRGVDGFPIKNTSAPWTNFRRKGR